MEFYSLPIAQIIQETEDTKTFQMNIPDALKDTFKYDSGQYITVEIIINDKKYRRAYSISSTPNDDLLAFTVKRLEKGLASNFIHENWQVNYPILIHKPLGNFTVKSNVLNEKTYVFVAAGSGITPVFSMINTILNHESKSKVHLLYGSRNEHQIIFKNQLDNLSQKFSNNFDATYCISAPNADYKGISGRISEHKIENWIDEKIDINENIYVYSCGPETLMETTFEVFRNRGLSSERIFREHFHSNISSNETNSNLKSNIKITLDGNFYTVEGDAKTAILDIILDNGIDAPYSCMSGSCGSCKTKLIKGEVKILDDNALSKGEKENGYILSCQALCAGEEIELNFDN